MMPPPAAVAATASAASDRPRSRLLLAVLAVLGLFTFIVLLALGQWQVERRAWKLGLIERVQERVHASPVAPPPRERWPEVDASNDEYRRVVLSGTWLDEKATWVQATTDLGSGYWLLMPLRTANGDLVFVNRGFVAQRVKPPAATSLVQVTGLLRISEPGGRFPRRNDPAQDRWYSRELPAIAARRGLQSVAPYFVDAEASASPAAGAPVGGLTVLHFNNNHLVYAITWYALAGMVLVAAVLVARQELRVRRQAHPNDHPAPRTADADRR